MRRCWVIEISKIKVLHDDEPKIQMSVDIDVLYLIEKLQNSNKDDVAYDIGLIFLDNLRDVI